MAFSAFIFDFDGTLGNSSECGLRATQEAFGELGYATPTRQEIDYYMGIPIEQSFKEMLNHSISDTDFSNLLALFRSKYAIYENDYLTAFPNVAEALAVLKQKGASLFILSSKKTEVILRNAATLEIADFFTEIVGADKVTAYKPDPSGIFYLLDKYAIPKEHAIMIGDATFDIEMGNRAEIATCAVTWGAHSLDLLKKENPTFIINTMTECLHFSKKA